MLSNNYDSINLEALRNKAEKIKVVFTDNDGVLTDTGVYYSEMGEELKRFSIRDGMGVERLRKIEGIETGIISGEISASLKKRAEKLNITVLYLGIKDKKTCLEEVLTKMNLTWEETGYIGDDYNDLELIEACGLTACPADAMPHVKTKVDYISSVNGGHGAFRDFAELIIMIKNNFEFKETNYQRTI
jgi:YrbI family 3-deoxy-D-manno-octulosonate 8-phosphate phosphatase